MMKIQARYGFPSFALALAGLALLAGCKTQWDRWDDHFLQDGLSKEKTAAYELTISRFQPGRTTIEDVEDLIGPTKELNAIQIGNAEPDGTLKRMWRNDWRAWYLKFTSQGTLTSLGRFWHGNMMMGADEDQAQEFDRWYKDRLAFLPVASERASEFTPGRTTQEDVLRAWGICMGGNAIPSGGYEMRWGSSGDSWSLQFDADGCLMSAPEHYVSK